VAWASPASTRCAATTSGPSSSNSPSVARSTASAALGRLLADEPVGPDPASGMLPVPGADEFSRARRSYQY
jgi:hypothetical protein